MGSVTYLEKRFVMSSPEQQSLGQIRAGIDGVDRELVRLLGERERLVRQAGQLKSDTAAVRAPDRVEQVIARVRTVAAEVGASPAVVEQTYRAMIAAFIDLELNVHHSATSSRHPAVPNPD